MRQAPELPGLGAAVRLWLELAATVLGGATLLGTLLWPQWIEAAFGVSPDGGVGRAEWDVDVGLCIFLLVMILALRREWRRAARAEKARRQARPGYGQWHRGAAGHRASPDILDRP